MRRVVFQHLTSEVGEKRLRDTIYLFGRQENGQSICVHVPNYKPHVTIKTNEKHEDFELKIQEQFLYLMRCEKAEYQKKYQDVTSNTVITRSSSVIFFLLLQSKQADLFY